MLLYSSTPTTDDTIPPGGESPVDWPPFEEGYYPYMYLDADEGGLKENYKQRDVAFWTQYLNRS